MIIFRPTPSSTEDIVNQVNNAISNGIGWIQLPTATMDESQARNLTESVIPTCRDNDIILTLENHVEVVNSLHNHGVHLMPGAMHPAFVRERLGPHAIIGMQISPDFNSATIKGVDIDYLTLDKGVTPEKASDIAIKLKKSGIETHLVVTGDYTPADIAGLPVSGILRSQN